MYVCVYISVSLNLINLQLSQLEREGLCNHQGEGSDLQAACSCSTRPGAWRPGSLRGGCLIGKARAGLEELASGPEAVRILAHAAPSCPLSH